MNEYFYIGFIKRAQECGLSGIEVTNLIKLANKTLVVAGIHGDEPAGDEAADKLTGVDKITRVNKTGKRRIDGKDPNRHFDKDTESKLQRDILNKIEEKNPDLVVAMHEDDEAKKPYAYASKSVADRLKDILKDKDTARSAHGDKTDGGVISEGNNPREGSLEKALDRRGIDRVTLETPSKTQSLNERVSTQTDIVNQLKEKSASKLEDLITLYHGSPTPDIEILEPKLDPRTGKKALFVSDTPHSPEIFSLMPHRHLFTKNEITENGKFKSGDITGPELNEEGYLYELQVPKNLVEEYKPGRFVLNSPAKVNRIKKVLREEILKKVGRII